ncbi:MAG TPA: DUF389 domain-containing protein [Prolixibacteraceae bacterium]|nr:DUF389 domain-containing protein [Prolixibacteraceae bacterium]
MKPKIDIFHYLNMDDEVDDFASIHSAIEKDIVFKGTNLWILVFAIIVASVGLNMNSTAVIIGAMLISPLMGPINGMGYSIATFNFPLFRKAIKNFSFAVVASLIASTTYFAISPVSVAHSELLARTSPTIYDVLIAFFGGLAGIIAISSKQKGNVIPGVAIATALMPPLCTAGYGLATAQFYYFFGAFYLFTINTVFIALSSVAISQILKFPIITLVNPVQKKKVNRWISVIILITVIPSIYFGYGLVQKEKFNEKASKFLNSVTIVEGNYLLDHSISSSDKSINLIYVGNTLTDKQIEIINEKADLFSIDKSKLSIKQGFSLDEKNSKNTENENLRIEINRLSKEIKMKDDLLKANNDQKLIGNQLLSELNSLFPNIHSCSYSESLIFRKGSDQSSQIRIIIIKTESQKLRNSEKEKIRKWMENRFASNQMEVYFE